MHLNFHPAFPNPVLLRGWGGLQGLNQGFISGYDDPVTRHGWGGLWGLGQHSGPPVHGTPAKMAAEGAQRTVEIAARSGLSGLGQQTTTTSGQPMTGYQVASTAGSAAASAGQIVSSLANVFGGGDSSGGGNGGS